MTGPHAPPLEVQRTDHAVVHSAGHGSPVLLLHGGMGSWTHWIRNIDPLAAELRVHALDLPGFGDAPGVARDLDREAYLDLVRDTVEAIVPGPEPLAVVGFSFGGAVAGDLCRRLGDRVRSLALIGPGGFGPSPGRAIDLRRAPVTNPSDSAFRAVLRHNLLAMMLADPASVDEATLDLQQANVERARFNSHKVSLQASLLDDLAAVSGPVLLIWGDQDVVAFPSIEARIASCRAARPSARVEIVPEAGHWAQYEQAARVNALLLDFLAAGRDAGRHAETPTPAGANL